MPSKKATSINLWSFSTPQMRAFHLMPQSLFIIGCGVLVTAACAMLIRFSVQHQDAERLLYDEAVAQRNAARAGGLAIANPA